MAKAFDFHKYAQVKGRAGGRARGKHYAELIGDQEMFAFIKKMDKDSDQGKLVKKGLQQAGKIIVTAAKSNARSVNAGERIIKSIRVMDIRKARKKYFFGVKVGIDYRLSSKTHARHAHLLEFGTARRYPTKHDHLMFKDKQGVTIYPTSVAAVSPRPFWRPAVDTKAQLALDSLTKEIKIAMAQYISKNASSAKFN